MKEELLNPSVNGENESGIYSLYPGIDLRYTELKSNNLSARRGAAAEILQINYCKSGQIAWKMKDGNNIYLNPGDFSLHRMNIRKDSAVTFPTGQYTGLTICIDLRETALNPPEPLRETDILGETLRKKFCQNDGVSFLSGNEQTESIFSGFYHQPEELLLPYQKIKVLELLLYLHKLEFTRQKQLAVYQSEQVEVIREIHDRLIQKIGERITIEELSKQYLINPTTLKAAFKTVYGTSIAAHIKEHRMKQAAKMLRESDMTIATIAQAVGYDSQSKFTAAFKAFFQVLPKEYKKKF